MFLPLILSATMMSPVGGVTGLKPLAQRLKLNLGAAVDSYQLESNADGGKYRQAVLDNFTMIEPENNMKPPSLWWGPNQYAFWNSDFLVNWAYDNHINFRAANLIYARDDGYTMPTWLLATESSITPAQARVMLHDYITAVVSRYKGKIFAWEVVNEAIDDSPNGNPFNLRNTFWYRKLGRDFLLDAFRFAHLADPKCKLYYNDYNVEAGGFKAAKMLQMVDYIRFRGVQIDGIGLQYHVGVGGQPSPGDGFYSMLTQIKNRGLYFMLSELDVSVPVVGYPQGDPNWGVVPSSPADLITQAANYQAYFKMALSFPNCQGVQMWGVNDSHSWIPWFTNGSRGSALLLDQNYVPKPAFYSVATELGLH